MNDKKQKMQNIYKVIMLLILSVTITCMLTTMTMYKRFSSIENKNTLNTDGISTNKKDSSLLTTLEGFKAMIKQKYIGEVDDEKMIEGAIKGFVEGLGDPYTQYLPKEEMDKFKEETNAEYVGIGVYLGNDTSNNTILVAGVMKGSPALEAGMQAGDIIEKVEDIEYTGEKLDDAIKILKGQEGTAVKVTVIRDGKEIELNVMRKKITIDHVASKMLENNIAYIQVDSFDKGVAKAFKEQYETLKGQGATKIIIDLRSNGGGMVSEALEIAELFIEKDETLLITKSKDNDEDKTKATKEPIIKDVPVVILVNQGTASASEILAGALKDKYETTTIVGKKTYGKGVIQTLYTLSDGSGIKITTEEYFTPNHNKINKEGITPDVDIELTKDSEGYYETSMDKDAQLLKAIEYLTK